MFKVKSIQQVKHAVGALVSWVRGTRGAALHPETTGRVHGTLTGKGKILVDLVEQTFPDEWGSSESMNMPRD
jgi:hypothetical protein